MSSAIESMYTYRRWPDKTVLSLGALICLSLNVDASNATVALAPQLKDSARVRSWLPSESWSCIGLPKNCAEVTEVDLSAGGWDEELEVHSSQQPFEQQRQRGVALWYQKEVKRDAYSWYPNVRSTGARNVSVALKPTCTQELHHMRSPACFRTYPGQFLGSPDDICDTRPKAGHGSRVLLPPKSSLQM